MAKQKILKEPNEMVELRKVVDTINALKSQSHIVLQSQGDNKKIDRIVMSSKIYLSKNKWKNSVRYDIIGITKNKINEKMVINWIKNAF